MMQLVPPEAVLAMAEVLTYGALKYGPEEWRTEPFVGVSRMHGGVLRHLTAWARGDDVDRKEEGGSGLEHLAHALAGLAIMYAKLKTQPGVDDRWFKLAKKAAEQ